MHLQLLRQTVSLDFKILNDSESFTRSFTARLGRGYITRSTVSLVSPVLLVCPSEFHIFSPSSPHTSIQKSSPCSFVPRKSDVALRLQATQWNKSLTVTWIAATFCSSDTLLRDLSSFQHLWVNKSQHRCYLGPNWSELFFHFIHLFNKYLLMSMPGAGDAPVSKIDFLMLRSLGETQGLNEYRGLCWSKPRSREICSYCSRGSNHKPRSCIWGKVSPQNLECFSKLPNAKIVGFSAHTQLPYSGRQYSLFLLLFHLTRVW